MEIDGDKRSEFLKRLKEFDGCRILYNMDNLLVLSRYRDVPERFKESVRRDFQETVDKLAKSGAEMLPGIDFDDVKEYKMSLFNNMIDDGECVLGKFMFGRFLSGSVDQDSGKKRVAIKIWDMAFPLKSDLIQQHPARLHNEVLLLTDEHLKSCPYVPNLIGYTIDKKLAVIYDFKPRVVLRNALLKGDLGWDARLKIAMQVAALLHKFHYTLNLAIGSIDSCNILIDEGDDIKLCEFGLIANMKKLPENQCLADYTAGLYSYNAPEFGGHNTTGVTWTSKIDVYAFGILLLELISKETFDADFLPQWADVKLTKGEKSVVDKSLLDDEANGAKITELAMACLEIDPNKRLEVETIVQKLEELKQSIKGKKPRVGT